MAARLLDRQVRLLDYLTSRGAIFGEGTDALLDAALHGIDPRLLRHQARFSYQKRIEKIIAVLPRTFRTLGARRGAIVREFVEACPPTEITCIENASQFYEFLCARWRHELAQPPYLPDVSACEFAMARVRSGSSAAQPKSANSNVLPWKAVRRHPNAVLLRCAYDVRSIFEGGQEEAAPIKRDTSLAIAIPPTAEQPRIFELLPPIFDVLGVLDNWMDRSVLGTGPEVNELIGELEQHGLVEMRR